jgi:hypothetical protein
LLADVALAVNREPCRLSGETAALDDGVRGADGLGLLWGETADIGVFEPALRQLVNGHRYPIHTPGARWLRPLDFLCFEVEIARAAGQSLHIQRTCHLTDRSLNRARIARKRCARSGLARGREPIVAAADLPDICPVVVERDHPEGPDIADCHHGVGVGVNRAVSSYGRESHRGSYPTGSSGASVRLRTLVGRRRGIGEGHVVAARGHGGVDIIDHELSQAILQVDTTTVTRGAVTEGRNNQCNTYGEHDEESERPENSRDAPCPVAPSRVESARCHGRAKSTLDFRHSSSIGRVDAVDISADFVQLLTHLGCSSALGVSLIRFDIRAVLPVGLQKFPQFSSPPR